MTLSLSYMIVDWIIGFKHGQNDLKMNLHHIMAITGYGTPWVYRRYGSFSITGLFVGEFSGPFQTLRNILPYMDDKKLSTYFYGEKGQNKELQHKQAENLRIINDLIFMVTFVFARMFLCEWLFFWIQYSDAPLYFKMQSSGLWFISFIWLWEIANKTVKLFADTLFPHINAFKILYGFLKKARPFMSVYLVWAFVFSNRYIFDYYGFWSWARKLTDTGP